MNRSWKTLLTGCVVLALSGGTSSVALAQPANKPVVGGGAKSTPAARPVPGVKPALIRDAAPAKTEASAPALKLPLFLYLFPPAVYDAERGIDGALLLSDAQRAQVAGLTESVRDEDERLTRLAREAESREQKIAAAKERAKFAMRSSKTIRDAVRPVLTPDQVKLVDEVGALFVAATAEVEQDFATRLGRAEGEARNELERAKPEMIAATFSFRLDEMLNDAQEAGVETRDAEVGSVLAREAARKRATEVVARKLESRRKAETERKEKEAAKQGFGSFVAGANGHEWSNAYLLSLAAHYAYPKNLGIAVRDFDDHELFEDAFAAKFMPWGISRVEFLTADDSLTVDAEAVVMSTDDAVIVTFRGSEGIEENTISGLKDWIATDFNAFFKEVPGIRTSAAVHNGFWNASGKIYRAIKREIRAQGGASKKVWVTGHSLGGGMAHAFTARYLKDGGKVQGLVTFASPRTGNGAFGDFLKDRAGTIQRWVYKNDIIPMAPLDIDLNPFDSLSGDNGKYLHVGRTNNIRKNGEVKLGDAEVKIPNGDYLTGDMLQHYPHYYCRGIHSNLPDSVRRYMPEPPARP